MTAERGSVDVAIQTEWIRLDQLLKLAGAVAVGGEAKLRIRSGEVSVNGRVETRRGRKLRDGDRVVCGSESYRVVLAMRSGEAGT